MRRHLTLFVALLMSVPAGAALGSPSDVVRDFRANGQLTRDYSTVDSQAALALVTAAERDRLSDAIVGRDIVSLLGVHAPARVAAPPPEATTPPASAVRTSNEIRAIEDLLPTPLREPATGLPLFVAVLAGLAGGLMIAGAASGVALRRLRRLR